MYGYQLNDANKIGLQSPDPSSMHASSGSPQAQNNYLPGFLMGDQCSAVNIASSVTKQSPSDVNMMRNSYKNEKLSRQVNTPPVTGLWSASNSGDNSRQPNNSQIAHSTPNHPHPPTTRLRNSNSFSRSKAPELHCSNLNVNNDEDSECWITIFGYPCDKASYVLQQFSQFGNIDKHVTTNEGNWMHVKYRNPIQARAALNKNGRVFGDNIMLGVQPCADQMIMLNYRSSDSGSRDKASVRPLGDRTNFNAGLNDLQGAGSRSVRRGLARNASMRPLGAHKMDRYHSDSPYAFKTSRLNVSSGAIQESDDQNGGIISKALGFVFGWS